MRAAIGWLRLRVKQVIARVLLLRSSLFDAEYYLAEFQARSPNASRPVLLLHHYLREGGGHGLNPSARFDTTWYAKAYPDVESTGLKPLEHYVLYGRAEGRIAHPKMPPERLQQRPKQSRVARLADDLWQGFSHLAIPELATLARSGDCSASLALASWYVAQGENADEWLALLAVEAESTHSTKAVVATSKYAAMAGANQLNSVAPPGPDGVFVKANRQLDLAARLDTLNVLFSSEGLAELCVKPTVSSSSLGSIEPKRQPLCAAAQQPLISVVVASYNAEAGLEMALRGLLSQSWERLEVIVVDDGSTDQSVAIAQRYSRLDERVVCVSMPHNQGAYAARNRGVAQATGDYITVHDSDDWSHPQKLEWQVLPLIRDDRLVASASHSVRVTCDVRFVGAWLLDRPFLEINASSWMYKRSVIDRCGLWDPVKVGADVEYSDRVRQIYGPDSLNLVCPGAPLSFMLADMASLTRARASHIQSQFFGLRRLYSEGYRWWHRASESLCLRAGERPFPLPLGNLRSPDDYCDCILAADLSVSSPPAELVSAVEARFAENQRIFVLHWPDYRAWPGNPVSDWAFELCHQYGLLFVHSGLTVRCPTVLIADFALLDRPTTKTVKVTELERVVDLNGALPGNEADLKRYFLAGGVQ